MKIKNIKINSYGILEKKEINFGKNINIIYGKNESGKSTLLNFIKNILYGISKNKNGKEISDYDKYLPWNGKNFSGRIEYQLDDGKSFEVFRDFYKRNLKVFNENLDEISAQFKIDKKDGNQFFTEQTGMSEYCYTSTIMSEQKQVILDNEAQNNMVQRIVNLGKTGEDDINFTKVMEKLNKRQIEEIGTNRTQDRPLNLLQKRSKEITDVLKTKKEHFEKNESLQEQKRQIEADLEQEKNDYQMLKEVKAILEEQKIEQEKNNLKKKLKDENEEKIKKIMEEKNKKNDELENLEQKNKLFYFNKNQILFSITFLFLIIINIYFFIKNTNIKYFTAIILFIEIITNIIFQINCKQKNKKEIKNKIQQIEAYNNQIYIIKMEIQKLHKEIILDEEKLTQNIKNKIQNCKVKYSNFYNSSIYSISDEKEVEKQIENINQKIMGYQLQLNRIQYEENILTDKAEEIILLEEEKSDIEEKILLLEEKNKCFEITKMFLKKAYEKMRNNVTPKFTEKLSYIANNISNGKYKNVFIQEQKGLIVEIENGEYIPANYLSVGTIDQLYLALRLAMIEEISKEKMPIILDEPFAYYDEERLKNILMFLANHCSEYQIILFTCQKREKEILERENLNYQWIEL